MRLNEAFLTYKNALKESINQELTNASDNDVIANADSFIEYLEGVPIDGTNIKLTITPKVLTLKEALEKYSNSNKRYKGRWYLPKKADWTKYFKCLKTYGMTNRIIWDDKKSEINKALEEIGYPKIENQIKYASDGWNTEESAEYWTATPSELGKYGNNVNFFGFGYFAPNPIYEHNSDKERKHRAILFCRQ